MVRRSSRLAVTAIAALAGFLVPSVTPAEPEVFRRFEEMEQEMQRRARGEASVADLPPELSIAPPPDVAEPPEDAEWTASGVAWKLIEPGDGDEPARLNDRVTVHYTGWTEAGVMFDTTAMTDEPVQYTVFRLLPGLTEGVMQMVEGDTCRMWVPGHLAFGDEEGLPKGAVVFDLQLVSIDERGPIPPPDVGGIPEDAVILDSGMAYRVLEPGHGDLHPGPEDAVQVHLIAFNTAGRVIDDSRKRERPISFALDKTSDGFAEALPLMVPGEVRRWWIPEKLANISAPPTFPGMLVFDLELLDFVGKPERPPDVSGIPPDAERTETGLAYKILKPGIGDRHPAFNDTVVVEYAGWTRDGTRFDSSYDHGTHGKLKLDRKKPLGWNEALQLMVVGEKRRIWIPEELAYGKGEGRPQGMLIFEVELLEIRED